MAGHGVEDQSQFAALFPGGDAVQADVEFGAIGRIGVLGMRVGHAESVDLGTGGTLEAAFQSSVLGSALLAVGLSGQVADALVLVEPQSGRASVFLGDTFDTGVEDVANALIGMSVEAVETGAKVVGALRGL